MSTYPFDKMELTLTHLLDEAPIVMELPIAYSYQPLPSRQFIPVYQSGRRVLTIDRETLKSQLPYHESQPKVVKIR